MASAAQIKNDLQAQARRFAGTGHDDLVLSLKRGATEIDRLSKLVVELEAAAEAEAERFERYRHGHDL